MSPDDQTTMVSKAMRNGMSEHSLSDPDWQQTLGRLQMLLARLIDPQDMDVFEYGEVGRPIETNLIVLLVTKATIYHADFQIRQLESDPAQWERLGSHNLRIIPRSSISEIRVDDIGTSGVGVGRELLRANYTVKAGGLEFSIPLGEHQRNQPAELQLLDSLHRDLAEK